MIAVILTIHSLIVLALIGVVLVQRSDGGALGIGGGGGGGGFMTGRGAANALTRTTSILAAGFFATSLGLAMLAGGNNDDESAIEDLTRSEDAPAITEDAVDPDEPVSAEDLLQSLGGDATLDSPQPSAADAVDEAITDVEESVESTLESASEAVDSAVSDAEEVLESADSADDTDSQNN